MKATLEIATVATDSDFTWGYGGRVGGGGDGLGISWGLGGWVDGWLGGWLGGRGVGVELPLHPPLSILI